MKRIVPAKPTTAKPGKMLAIPGSTRVQPPQARLVKKCDLKEQIKVSIYARPNPTGPGTDPAAIDEMNAKLPGERRYLTGKDFDARFGADPAELAKIEAWAKSCKLKVIDSSVAKRRVLVQGSIGDINKAFGVELNEYEHPQSGRFRARVGQVHVPGELAGVVQGVFGLDTRPVGKPRRRRSTFKPVDVAAIISSEVKEKKHRGHAATANPFPGTFFPTDLAQLYSYPETASGSGQNVAIFAFNGSGTPDTRGGYVLSALQNYFEKVIGGTAPKIKDVVVQGPGNDPGPDSQASGQQGDSTGEVMLDMCVVGSVAPGANIFMYFTEFTSQGWVDALNEAVTDANDIAVISISYGNPEDDPQGAWTAMGVRQVNQALQAAAAKGITVCCASGDDGSADQVTSGAHVDFPASSPNVLGVGGTKVVASSGSNAAITSETVWNETMQSEGATGGGVSAVFTKPAYQDDVNVPPSANPPHKVGRGVPDVAADADPETGVVVMHVDGKQLEVIGGTSAAAPMWASLVLRLNQGLGARCGFLNTVLYEKFATGVLRDITVGNNGAYSAGSGWDACTGLGSPNGERLLTALSGSAGAATQSKKAGS
jgi:kumamolisin